jgi:hypothetical protein
MIDLSSPSDEEGFVADTSRVFEFTQRLYAELNRDFLGPVGDDKVIILSDSDEEQEEACEKSVGGEDAVVSTAVNTVSTTSTNDICTLAEKSSTPAASPADAVEDLGTAPNDSSDGLAPGPKMEEGSGGGDEAAAPYATTPRTTSTTGVLQGKLHSTLLPFFLLCVEELG